GGKPLTKDQEAFLGQAIKEMAHDGKVVPVRLALFAEMVKGKNWNLASLKALGGTEGIGVAFLEQTFESARASPKHRLHRRAANAVLKALLPEGGSDIRGHMRSQAHLLEASGYTARPKEFDDLMGVLDKELRLVTPTDPDGPNDAERMNSAPNQFALS